MLFRWSNERAIARLQVTFPDAQVVLFGHSHLAFVRRVGGQLFLNPGTPRPQPRFKLASSVGLLRIAPGGEVQGEIILLDE
jgi:predicted phosphodiesterase